MLKVQDSTSQWLLVTKAIIRMIKVLITIINCLIKSNSYAMKLSNEKPYMSRDIARKT